MTTSMSDWLDVARAFLPRLADATAPAEHDRQFPSELVQAMAGAGLFRLRLPARYGGAELDHTTYYQVIELVARTNASAAWLIAIGNEAAAGAGYMDGAGADEVFGPDPNVIVAGALKARRCEIQEVHGGSCISGQWALASGCSEASWLGAAVFFTTPSGQPDLRMLLVPRESCMVLDTWDALGLRATSSHDFVIEDAFVPARRQITFPGVSDLPGPLWRGNLRTHLGGVGPVALGVAQSAIDELKRLAADKVPFGSRGSLRDRPSAQSKLAEAEALVRASRAFLYESVDALWQQQLLGAAPAEEQLTVRELAVAHTAQASAQAVRLLFDAAGSDAVYASSRLERAFRDVHVITQHVAGSTNRYEQLGRFLISHDVGDRRQ